MWGVAGKFDRERAKNSDETQAVEDEIQRALHHKYRQKNALGSSKQDEVV